jgi:hypothetical protein
MAPNCIAVVVVVMVTGYYHTVLFSNAESFKASTINRLDTEEEVLAIMGIIRALPMALGVCFSGKYKVHSRVIEIQIFSWSSTHLIIELYS